MELLDKTIIRTKVPGDTLTSKEINSINTAVNNLVSYTNAMISKYCDINLEYGNSKKQFSLGTAVSVVPAGRRTIGMKIRFFNFDNNYSEYSFIGSATDEDSWKSEKNWINESKSSSSEDVEVNTNITVIDGGEW